MIDPVTCYKYRKDDLSTLDQSVVNRLEEIKQVPDDVLETRYFSILTKFLKQNRMKRWEPLSNKLKDAYDDKITKIDASLSIENIIEKISFSLEHGIN